LRTVTITEQF